MKLNGTTQITGNNVILVPYKQKHVERYHEWMKSEELRYLTASEPLSLEEEFEMQQHWHEDDDKCTFIVLDKDTLQRTNNEIGAMIGDTNIFLDDPSKTGDLLGEIEIMIADTKYRRKRRGWEATILMLLYGIETLKVTEYKAKIKFDNQKSMKMFERLGFTEVSRSQVFEEITFGKTVDQCWKEWLHSQLTNAVKYESYS